MHIYLTFDDGPLNGTLNCFKAIIENNLKATFFFVGIHASNNRGKSIIDTLRKSDSLIIGNHSYSHANEEYVEFYKNFRQAKEDFLLNEKLLKLDEKIIRLPGNNSWAIPKKIRVSNLTRPLVNELFNDNYSIIGWDIEFRLPIVKSYDIKNLTEKFYLQLKFIEDNKLSFIENHIVILLHDWMFQTANSIQLLNSLLKKIQLNPNWKFNSLKNYPLNN